MADTIAAYSWLMDKAGRGEIDGAKVCLAGRSLGGAVAIAATAQLLRDTADSERGSRGAGGSDVGGASTPRPSLRAPCALILENTFTSISSMVDTKFPFLNVPFFKELFMRLKWDSIGTIPSIALPILFLSSARDEIVPREQMVALHAAAAAASPRQFHSFAGAMHNDIWVKGGMDYWRAKQSFMSEFCERR